MSLLINLERHRLPATVGNKALNLHRLHRAGLKTPPTLVCVQDAYRRYMENDVSLIEELRLELGRKLDPIKCYAVRSSANVEDTRERSFAGQFKSVLNAQGADAVLQAMWSVWSSARSPAVLAYLSRQNIPLQQLSMAVIIQEMVPAEASGVALSRNPVTGADEVVVEAVRGLGDALVQGGVTPQRWINKWNNWLLKPATEFVPLAVMEQLVTRIRQIARRFRTHVDIEWAYDGKDLYFLQMREITTLNRHNVYSNHISKEMLPGIIKPLISSINIPLAGATWVRLLSEMIGSTRLTPGELARCFYYRVYFNMGVLGRVFEEVGMPADSIELIMNLVPAETSKPAMRPTLKTLLRFPRMLKFAMEKWNFALPMSHALPILREKLLTFDFLSASALPEWKLVAEAERLYRVMEDVTYFNKVAQILMGMFNSGLRIQLARVGVDLKDFDLMEDRPEIEAFNPNKHLHDLHGKFLALDPEIQTAVRHCSYSEFMEMEGLQDFQARVSTFVEQFGHLSDNGNDFSTVPWRETPDMVKQIITEFVPEKLELRRKVRFAEVKKNPVLRALYKRARDFRYLREQVSSLYTYGYGMFRYYYQAMGAALVRRGWIDERDDIFYLTRSEIHQAVLSPTPLADYRAVVQRHKTDIERFRTIPLPSIIHGDEPPPVQDAAFDKLIGIPTSIGHYTGTVASVRGLHDFPKVKHGDVLVIPYSDVSWTPLFARAGAVVSESGGLLSHSSIVAREYNIPAVVSAEGAMRLSDHTLVTVNGHTGEVFIHNQ